MRALFHILNLVILLFAFSVWSEQKNGLGWFKNFYCREYQWLADGNSEKCSSADSFDALNKLNESMTRACLQKNPAKGYCNETELRRVVPLVALNEFQKNYTCIAKTTAPEKAVEIQR